MLKGLVKKYNLTKYVYGISEYIELVDELYRIKNEAMKKKQDSQCLFCQKANLTNPYVYQRDNYGYSKVFCNADCYNKWTEKQNQYTCEWCKQSKSGQYWYLKGSRNRKKFCSEQCLNHWKEQQKLKNTSSSKKCASSNCSNKLTENDVLYCQTCINKNEQAFENVQRIGEELKDMARDFQNKLTCPHNSIVYEENNPYFWFCEDCDDDGSPMFINKLQEDLVKDINEDYFTKYNLTASYLKKTSNYFTKLSKKEFTNQEQIGQAYQQIEQELKQLTERERESKFSLKLLI